MPIPNSQFLIPYTLFLADTTLILAQRNAEWCAHGPGPEQDIAITNISLDLIGQSRNFYQYAAQLTGNGATEDSLAYFRNASEFKNLLLAEQPNGDWGQTILRLFFFSTYQVYLYKQLENGSDSYRDEQLSAIATKALKEVAYHVRWSSEWVIRLGDGTEESHQRMLNAIEQLWPFTGELFEPAPYETAIGIDLSALKKQWMQKVNDVFKEATLPVPPRATVRKGGKTGNHTEHLSVILEELQDMQRTYPGMEW
jgi:ring-1,2-phenylacetyl-CoA epoxidase subunit PaaC